MSFDLFFLPKGANIAKVRVEGFKPTPTQRKAFAALRTAMATRDPGIVWVDTGDGVRGRFDKFPFGQLEGHPGCLHWSLSGNLPAESDIREFVDWFLAQGYRCEDPQDAGYGNGGRPAKTPSGEGIDDWDQLVRARFRAFAMDVEEGQALTLEFRMPDDRVGIARFVGAIEFLVPGDQRKLHDGAITAVTVDRTGPFDRYTFVIDNGLSISFLAAAAVEAKIHKARG